MKIVHIESGLGNQMLSYCEYLALKFVHPDEDIFIETYIYDIPEANDFICQWNGFELTNVFDIDTQNIKTILSEEQNESILKYIKNSKFWNKNWNWPVYFTEAFQTQGIFLNNIRGNFENDGTVNIGSTTKFTIRDKIKRTGWYSNLRRFYKSCYPNRYIRSDRNMLFYKGVEDVLTGQRLTFKYVDNDIEMIDNDIKNAFRFKKLTDLKNKQTIDLLKSVNSVAIHARRGDMLTVNGQYYKSGYFNRAVSYIKRIVSKPVFIFFCDPGSIEWCKNNSSIFGLNYSKDEVIFVDWNKGESSFRDMQLMSCCKHNIITNSSFGWWGAYLNDNIDKITISPEIEINTTHHF